LVDVCVIVPGWVARGFSASSVDRLLINKPQQQQQLKKGRVMCANIYLTSQT
jgi:hypothetical protein